MENGAGLEPGVPRGGRRTELAWSPAFPGGGGRTEPGWSPAFPAEVAQARRRVGRLACSRCTLMHENNPLFDLGLTLTRRRFFARTAGTLGAALGTSALA